MEVKTKLKLNINYKKNDVKFQVVILNDLKNKALNNTEILGMLPASWLQFACEEVPNKIVNFEKLDNVFDTLRDNIDTKYDYTIALFSSTPLVTHDTIKDIMEYSAIKELKLCKLNVGYVANNEYLLQDSNKMIDSIYTQNIDDFYMAENKTQLNHVKKILMERINNFHINNGVEIVNPEHTYIEPFVDIGNGVKIYPNNSLKGKTTIYSDVILKENNVIENSKIGVGSCIAGSLISDTIISSNVYVSTSVEIRNSLIGSDTIIEHGATITKFNVAPNSKIHANEILGETDDSNSGTR